MAEAHREEIAKLEALYAAHPEGRVFTHLAEAYRRAGELSRAREILEDGLRRHPDYSSAHVVFGRVLMDLNETAAATSAFRRVLDLDRHNLVALRSLGDLAERSGETAAAVGYYRDLIALDPTDDRLRLAVARLEEELATRAQEPAAAAAAPEAAEMFGVDTADEPAPGDTGVVPVEEEPVSFPEFSADAPQDEEEEPVISFPTLADAEGTESFEFEAATLDVEGLDIGWDPGAAPADLSPPAGYLEEDPAVDDAIASPELVPDAFAGMGWTAGDTADARPDEERTGSGSEPVGDEALTVDDDAWAGLGERAASAWTPSPEPPAADDIEEVTTWGPPVDALPQFEQGPAPEPSPFEYAEPEPLDEGVYASLAEPPGADREEGEAKGRRAPSAGGEMVTATMAELYAQQGFYDRAVDVYRQLLEQVPEDERLRERLAEIELLGRAAAAERSAAEESEAEATSVWTGAAGVAGGEETPYAWADSPAGEGGGEDEATVGAYLRALLSWRPAGEDAWDRAAEGPPDEGGELVLETGAVAAAFEEWFGEEGESGEREGAPDADDEAGEEDADLAMFRSWLQSLKK